ncbi:MAG TPA: hypothetical protein VFX84_01055, partial [Candidatus Saccharimonadales bacterium]|nr:hypothetical protein [Candidatus Saccharimonadales bacterium]
LRPSTIYTVRMDGPSGKVLGTFVSDGSGNVAGNMRIPADSVPGGHRIDLTGPGRGSRPVDVTRPLYVIAGDADADGDAIDDALDTCPGAMNSGRDNDRDGIDDICDNLAEPSTPSAAGSMPGTHGSGTTITGTARVSGNSTGIGAGNRARGVRATISTMNAGDERTFETGARWPWLVPAITAGLLLVGGKINKRGGFWLQ